jgi:hypothetical protein
MSVYYMTDRPPVLESRQEDHDRREYVALYTKANASNREEAQWLLDHPIYTAPQVAKWAGGHPKRIQRLRQWAKGGFVESGPQAKSQQARNERSTSTDQPLKTKEDFQDDDFEPSDDEDEDAIIGDGVEHPEQVVINALDTIKQEKAVAEAYRKIFKRSRFDSKAKAELYNAINNLIAKWRAVQSSLDKKGHDNGKN